MPFFLAISWILAAGPTRIGTIRPFWPASIAPSRAVFSHGCATAVGTGSRLRHLSSSASYLPVPVIVPSCRSRAHPADRWSRLFQKKQQHNRQGDAEEQRLKRRLVMLEG